MPKIDELLEIAVARRASDLHLTTSFKPHLRVDGGIVAIAEAPLLTEDVTRDILREIMPPKNRAQFEQDWDTDFGYEAEGLGRFRVNVFMDNHGMGGVLRTIPAKIPTLNDLGMPRVLKDFCFLSKGLVVVTGPTGSGKSTTLAAMIDFINRNRTDHIITIEDPIEFVHRSRHCLINQREVHAHTKSFSNALRAALREDPDIVLVGEMRDLETVEIAIETAETGHLVFGTLHTNTAASTVNRIIDQFPADRQNQVRTMLADSLKGVVAQTLCKKKSGGRVAAVEILVVNYAIASNIREGKTHQIPSLMQVGKSSGMQLFNDALLRLVVDGVITNREAYLRAVDKDALMQNFEAAGFKLNARDLEEVPTSSIVNESSSGQAQSEETIRTLRGDLARTPESVDILNNLAWLLATSPHIQSRNASEAIKFAEQAESLTAGKNAAILDTLSVAYAAANRFDQALATARKALAIAEAEGQRGTADALRQQITHYEAGRLPAL
jgi:twitching motility protein PilT